MERRGQPRKPGGLWGIAVTGAAQPASQTGDGEAVKGGRAAGVGAPGNSTEIGQRRRTAKAGLKPVLARRRAGVPALQRLKTGAGRIFGCI